LAAVLSIIVPARNNNEFTATCLGSILFSVNRLNLNAEFILIDDDSPPQERILDVFRQHRINAAGHVCKILRSRKHQHYTGVFSLGLNFATRDIIFFISNDMIMTPHFLQALLLVSSLSREFGIVRGTSNHTDSHPEHCVVPDPMPTTYQEIDKFSREAFNTHGCGFTEDGVLSGDAVLIKRALVERIGVLDLRYFGYFGDIDYGLRAHLAGFKLVCAKGAWLYHDGSGHVKRELAGQNISVEDMRARRLALVETAYQEFRKKWHVETPTTYQGANSAAALYFFEHARAHGGDVEQKYELPGSALNDVEIH
jgi:GT2 family glycosyltransferase